MLYSLSSPPPTKERRYLAEYYDVISTEGSLLFTQARSKSPFNTTVDMKLKQIFALLGVALLGLSACAKDTPKTNPASSGSLAGSQWEYIEQELEDDGKTETTTTALRFIDGTKFVTESTSVTTQGARSSRVRQTLLSRAPTPTKARRSRSPQPARTMARPSRARPSHHGRHQSDARRHGDG